MKRVAFRASAVVFDLDGVLVDSMAAIRAQWIEWGERHGFRRATRRSRAWFRTMP
jgi:beta-phosphoglucomutase-like phosphatase (HAD superfamily)